MTADPPGTAEPPDDADSGDDNAGPPVVDHPPPSSPGRAQHLAHALATALLAGPWQAPQMSRRCAQALNLDSTPAWVDTLIGEVLGYHRDPPVDAPRHLQALLLALPAWAVATRRPTQPSPARRSRKKPTPAPLARPVRWEPTPTAMARADWPVRRLDTVADLARLVDVDAAELDWFADVRGQERGATAPLRHYRVLVRAKAGGVRVIEAPKPRLREIQRRVLRHVLAPIPLHPAAHGCVPGRSVATAVREHAGNGVVVRADLEAFFAAVSAPRVYGVLRRAGYPETVAHCLAGLCTTVLSRSGWLDVPIGPDADRHHRLGRFLATPHLPQGAPTSPALANLVAFSLDRRLGALARARGLTYTRYVDDLVFSGARVATGALLRTVRDIAADEGFGLAAHKSVVLSRAGRQQVLGAVINDRVGVSRTDADRLRAILHNCVVSGWSSQARGVDAEEFRQQLAGRIAWMHSLNPERGDRLRAQFDRIAWPD